MKATPGAPTHVTTKADAQQLGQRLLDRQRTHPFVVLSLDKAGRSSFDPDEIAAALRHKADVWVVDSAHSWTLNHDLGSETVFGDAAGVYPPHREGRFRRHLFTPGQGHSDQSVVTAAREAAPGRSGRPTVARNPTARPATVSPRTGLHRVETPEQVDALAAHLLSPGRDRPVAVVTIPMQRSEPWIDAQEIVDAVGPEAEVHLIETGPRTFQLTDHLNRLAGVYGGAGRVYDVGRDWLANHYLSPLRFAYDKAEGSRATADLITDLMSGLARTGHLTTESPATAREVRGTVEGLVPPSRAFVRLEDQTMATVWAELTAPGLDISAVLERGMPVTGLLDPESRRIHITAMLRTAATARAELSPGDVVLARVERVLSGSVTLTPFPGVSATVAADLVTGNDLDDLTELLTHGEVVAARYLGGDDEQWRLSLLDVDDDEAVVPLALIASGPAWLRDESEATPDADTPVAHADDGQEDLRAALDAAETRQRDLKAANGKVSELAHRIAQLEIQLSARDIEVDTLQREVRDGQREVRKLAKGLEHERAARRRAVQKSNKTKAAPAKEIQGYADPVDQVRWDIRRTWVEQTRPEDKAAWPLPDGYAVGPEFCRTVDDLEGVSRDRVLLVALWVLTGRGVTDDHPLRSSKAGGAPPVTRVVDGVEWICRRAPLQQSSSSARRLSYWRSPTGRIELSRVTVHDDLTP